MASPELTSTLTIIDKSSNVLEAIGKQAEKTSNSIDRLLSAFDMFGNIDISNDIENSLANAEDLIERFEDSLNSISNSGQSLELSVDTSSAERQIQDCINSTNEIVNNTGEQIQDEINNINHVVDNVESQLQDNVSSTIEAANNIEGTFERLGEEVLTLDDSVNALVGNMEIETSYMSMLKRKISGMKSSLMKPIDMLKGAFNKISFVVGKVQEGIEKLREVAEIADRNTSQKARFRILANAEGFTGSDAVERGEQMRKRASEIASEIGVDTMEFNDQLIAFANNAAFKSFEEAANFAETLQKSFIAAGTGAQEAESATRQLLQGLSKGKLQGEDLRSIMSAAPQIGALLEQSVARLDGEDIDEYKGKIMELGTQGKLTADVIKDAIFGATEQINRDFESMPMTFETSAQKVKNHALEAFQSVLDQFSAIPESKGFEGLMKALNGIVDAIAWVVDKVMYLVTFVIDIVGSVVGVITDVIGSVFDFVGDVANFVVDGISDIFTDDSSKKKKSDKTTDAVVNQTALQKMSYQKIYDAQVDQLEVMDEQVSILDRLSEQQKKYYQTAGAGLGTYRQQQDAFLENIEENMILGTFQTDEELSKRHGYDKETKTFQKSISWEDYLDVWENRYGKFKGENAIPIHSTAELLASKDRIEELKANKAAIEALQKSKEFKQYKRGIQTASLRVDSNYNTDIFDDEETQDRFNRMIVGALNATDTKNVKKLVDGNFLANKLDEIGGELSTLTKAVSIVDKALNTQFAENNKFAEGTERNTRSVHINRDDIEFMRSMTTAEVINRYNTLSSSIVQNNHFAQAPTSSSFGNITARGIQAASNSARALVGA